MKQIAIVACLVAIVWDVVTTYYGTLAVFTLGIGGGSLDVFERITYAPFVAHIASALFAFLLITFILSYKVIMRSRNAITKPLLYVAFVYDFCTSFYGTTEALNQGYSNYGLLAIILFLSIMVTASPILISQLLDD